MPFDTCADAKETEGCACDKVFCLDNVGITGEDDS